MKFTLGRILNYILKNKDQFENLISAGKSLADVIKLFKDGPGLQVFTRAADSFLNIIDVLMRFTGNNNIVS
jgi:hypothetical protein